eukprot:459958-Amphidinium_carterae.1
MTLLTDPDNGVVMVPNLDVDNLEVIPEPEAQQISSSHDDAPHDFVSVLDSASALDHYEEVNNLMEQVLFDSWHIETTERPASWHEGFSRLLLELNGRLLED